MSYFMTLCTKSLISSRLLDIRPSAAPINPIVHLFLFKQGLGLYAAHDIEKHTMVIEYIGTLIRNEVANKWERDYEAANRGVYMFRIDDYTVVDATRSGNPARYINHSCNPNCVAEVVNFDKDQKKIIIISSRRLLKGEEVGP